MLNHDATPEQESVVARIKESAISKLGIHPSPHDRREYPTRGLNLIWNLDPLKAEDAVAWHDALGALPMNWLGGTALLSIDVRFRFTSPNDHGELPHQGSDSYLNQPYDGYGRLLGESVCRLTLSSKSALSVLFFLPFEDLGDPLWRYVAFLQAHAPFKFSERHWRQWHLNKKRTSYTAKKIKAPALP